MLIEPERNLHAHILCMYIIRIIYMRIKYEWRFIWKNFGLKPKSTKAKWMQKSLPLFFSPRKRPQCSLSSIRFSSHIYSTTIRTYNIHICMIFCISIMPHTHTHMTHMCWISMPSPTLTCLTYPLHVASIWWTGEQSILCCWAKPIGAETLMQRHMAFVFTIQK